MKTWTKTRIQGLMRHKTGTYYARLFVGGKEKWVSLKTHSLEVAKGKMRSDEQVNDVRDAQARKQDIIDGKMTVVAAADLYKGELKHRVILKKIKPSTEEFWHTVWNSVVLRWPELPDSDVNDISAEECKTWFANFAVESSPSYSNNTLCALKNIFDQALEKGVLFRNPFGKLERVKIRPTELVLPTREQFHAIVAKVRHSGHRTAEDAANTIEFLAYSGCRIGEARRVLKSDCNFEKGETTVKGDFTTGTKNWEIRVVPMIPDLRVLLERMNGGKGWHASATPVLSVSDVRGSLGPAALAVGAPYITHHDLRHLFATTCIEANVDIPTIARWLGHKDGGALAMKIYGHQPCGSGPTHARRDAWIARGSGAAHRCDLSCERYNHFRGSSRTEWSGH